jgi:hypothetical protein
LHGERIPGAQAASLPPGANAGLRLKPIDNLKQPPGCEAHESHSCGETKDPERPRRHRAHLGAAYFQCAVQHSLMLADISREMQRKENMHHQSFAFTLETKKFNVKECSKKLMQRAESILSCLHVQHTKGAAM